MTFDIKHIRQDLNLCGGTPTDFKSVTLTTRPRMMNEKWSKPPKKKLNEVSECDGGVCDRDVEGVPCYTPHTLV